MAKKETALVRHECVFRTNTQRLKLTNEYRPQRAKTVVKTNSCQDVRAKTLKGLVNTRFCKKHTGLIPACDHVCTYVCMYVCMYVRTYVPTYIRRWVGMYECA